MRSCILLLTLLFGLTVTGLAQASTRSKPPVPPASISGPKVTEIDIEGLRALIKPKGRPLLVNFWATWCDPCREEFPDLVKLHESYGDRLDFITISLDDLADINGGVPKFLSQMKSTMPAYLLHTADEDAAIALIAKNWSGNLPMTVLYNTDGSVAYIRMGKLQMNEFLPEINKVAPAIAKGDE